MENISTKRKNGITVSIPLKVTAWIMLIVFTVTIILGSLGIAFMFYLGFFTSNYSSVITNISEEVQHEYSWLYGVFGDSGSAYSFLITIYSYRNIITATPILSLIGFISVIVYLIWSAGRVNGESEFRLNIIDYIPFDIYLGLLGFVALIIIAVWEDNFWYWDPAIFLLIPPGVLIIMAASVSFSARVKCGNWWKNTLIFYLLCLIYKLLSKIFKIIGAVFKWTVKVSKAIFRGISKLFSRLISFWKVAFIFIAYTGVGLISAAFLFIRGSAPALAVWILIQLCALVILMAICHQLILIFKYGKSISDGRSDEKIDLSQLYCDFRTHGENLSSISKGIEVAVNERMKSEHMRTELITNVSHDIKTPLTSIINYVDLLSREPITDKTQLEYIDVITRQAAKLRKLTEDIVEASKASSGAINIEIMPTDLTELITQCAGEYEERFEKANLIPVIDLPQEKIIIDADGRLLWRVLDNLFGNVCKYSLEGTRVYISLSKNISGEVSIIIRNISRDQLNISADELSERFVRGDVSRNTEGSGLGLSIAKSLTALMDGELIVSIDGDLFRCEIRFC